MSMSDGYNIYTDEIRQIGLKNFNPFARSRELTAS